MNGESGPLTEESDKAEGAAEVSKEDDEPVKREFPDLGPAFESRHREDH